MLEREREETILRLLRQNRFVSLHEVAALVNASEATVRRDFTRLEREGLLRRLRGGAELLESQDHGSGATTALPRTTGELPFEYRKGIMLEKKRLIARKAVSLCQDQETIIIDGGSTIYQMVEFLKEARLQIITNSFAIAVALLEKSHNRIIIPEGIIYPDSQLILNPFKADVFENYSATKVFMGVEGIDEQGATNSEMLLIRTERAMIEHGKELIILADSSKFNRRGNLKLCGFEKIDDIITDSGVPDRYREILPAKGVNLIVV